MDQAVGDHESISFRSMEEPLVREYAAWAMGRLRGEEAKTALQNAFDEEADDEVKAAIESALNR